MEFDIHQKLFEENGDYLEKERRRYSEQLLELFEQSSEAQELWNEGNEPRWADMTLEYGMNYLGVAPPQMTEDNLRELLLEIFPQKISVPGEEAPETIRELQLFWTFLGREFQLKNAASCLKVLNERTIVDELKKEMDNPANFGMAKSFVMMGMERGFDMTTQEGIDEWMKIYNAELASSRRLPFSLPEPEESRIETLFEVLKQPVIGSIGGRRTRTSKTKRKMVKNSRKQNRAKR